MDGLTPLGAAVVGSAFAVIVLTFLPGGEPALGVLFMIILALWMVDKGQNQDDNRVTAQGLAWIRQRGTLEEELNAQD